MQTDVVIIGAGAAGLMCAAEAGKRLRRVLLLDHAEKIGKKILISGGGRCNFTNIYTAPQNFISENPHFCKSALARYTPHDFISLVERHGISYHEKKLGQLFCDNSARDIVAMLESECRSASVEILTDCSVQTIERLADGTFCLETSTSIGELRTNAVVIATGGLSIPKMGATDFGHRVAQQFGLRVTPMKPALVPLTLQESERLQDLAGVALESIAECNGVPFRENILFTHHGLSGPAVLQASSYWNPQESITLNTIPDLDTEQFRLANVRSATTFKNLLAQHLPKRFVEAWCERSAADIAQTPFANVPERRYEAVMTELSAWRITPNGTEGYAKAEVTAGGVCTNELSSKTMESKRVPGLYFIGEVVDVTGWLGGYNFQWAWASGAAAGRAV
jgi:predicted Rossmann fold flavoprotein